MGLWFPAIPQHNLLCLFDVYTKGDDKISLKGTICIRALYCAYVYSKGAKLRRNHIRINLKGLSGDQVEHIFAF